LPIAVSSPPKSAYGPLRSCVDLDDWVMQFLPAATPVRGIKTVNGNDGLVDSSALFPQSCHYACYVHGSLLQPRFAESVAGQSARRLQLEFGRHS
jgi:hypothetical protein